MRIVVIGAGIIGVTTAYFLRRDGHEVSVIERRSGVAQETSFANAGVMAPSYVAPVVAARYAGQGPCILVQGRSADRISAVTRPCALALDRALARRVPRRTVHAQQGAHAAPCLLQSIRVTRAAPSAPLDYEQATGYLQLFRSNIEVERSSITRKILTDLGIAHALLTPEQTYAIEPALHPPTPLAGALHLPNDETGNCAFFAQQLKDIAIRRRRRVSL